MAFIPGEHDHGGSVVQRLASAPSIIMKRATVSLQEADMWPSVGSNGVFAGANATVSFSVVSGPIISKSASLALQRILNCLIL